MKDKITFKDLNTKGKEIIWNSKKNEDDTHKVTIVYDNKKEIVLQKVPCQYVKEDGDFEQKVLDEKESQKLVDRRIQSLINQMQQSIFTTKFYGGNIEGYVTSGSEKEVENGKG